MIKELMHDPIFLAGKSEDTTIIKLVYKREFFDISVMKPGGRLVTTILNDGTVIFKEYSPESRKAQSVYKGKRSVEDYKTLCAKLEKCIEFADRLDFCVDDASEELKIYHKFGRVQIMDRGLGNENVHIGEIMHDYLDGVMLDD